jgi:hypothetical protein
MKGKIYNPRLSKEQRTLHVAAAKYIGTISGPGRTADGETVRKSIRARLARPKPDKA